MRISDWSSDVCSSDLRDVVIARTRRDIAVAGDSEVGGERAGIEAGTDADTAKPERDIIDAGSFSLFVERHQRHAVGIQRLEPGLAVEQTVGEIGRAVDLERIHIVRTRPGARKSVV